MITKLAIKKINLMYVQVKYTGQKGDEKRSHNHWCWVTLQELLLDNTGKEKKQSCLSTEDDVRATAGGEMIEVCVQLNVYFWLVMMT